MRKLWTEDLLSGWERGRAEPFSVGRALSLLGAAHPDVPPAALAELCVGERDALLLRLREELFGRQITGLAQCGGCGERLEVSFDTSDLHAPEGSNADPSLTVSSQGYTVEFRLPNSGDLLMLGGVEDVPQKLKQLLDRIVLSADCAGSPIRAEDLPEQVILEIESRMQESDPRSEVMLQMHCASCGREWSQVFDVGDFLWHEVDAWALRLLREVDRLARAYGWREADILAMTALRRHAYLEMIST